MRGRKMMSDQDLAKLAIGGLAAAVVALVAAAPPASAAAKGTMAPRNAPASSNEPAGDAPFLAQGKRVDLHSFKGQSIMLWQVATWCGSCAVGLRTMAQHLTLIDASNIKIIILQDYKNGGYPGEGMEKFVAKNAPALLHDAHFIIGKDTEKLFNLYNRHHYIDVYHLIQPNGRIAVTSSAPSATFDKIAQFIKAKGES